MSEQSVPVLLTSRGAGSPSEPDLSVGTVRKLLVTDFSDFAGFWVSAEVSPTGRTCGLFHDEEVFAFYSAHEVSFCGGTIRDIRGTPNGVVVK